MTPIKLTESEMAAFKPFHEFIVRKREELAISERMFLEYILTNRKVQNEPHLTQHPIEHATEPWSDDAAAGKSSPSGSDAASHVNESDSQSNNGESRSARTASA
jgi:hypothetical protein